MGKKMESTSTTRLGVWDRGFSGQGCRKEYESSSCGLRGGCYRDQALHSVLKSSKVDGLQRPSFQIPNFFQKFSDLFRHAFVRYPKLTRKSESGPQRPLYRSFF